jgi:tyrosyl-tRNA synthetase
MRRLLKVSAMTLLEELQWRGLYADCTDLDALTQRLAKGPTTLYCGFDPTADSLHVGNLVPLLALRRFQLFGHHPIALAGGATGMVGDPSGKSSERNLQTPEQVAHNIACIKQQLSKFLDFETAANPARLVDNASWTAPITFLEFLRDVGKYFSVNQMIAKDSVRSRLESEGGISYTEFSYMLLQAFDFYHLRQSAECEIQVGATDQWGNITAGTDLIRKKLGAPAWGLTFPLLTKSDGTKYGKSASGAVWLDPVRTTPYRFYQFFVQAEDADVVKLLKVLTFKSQEEIAHLEGLLKTDPQYRHAQRALAKDVTMLVHGPTVAATVERASDFLFKGGEVSEFTEELFREIVGEIPTKDLERAKLTEPGTALLDLLVHAGLCPSRGQARKDLEGGGIYLNNVRVAEIARAVTTADLLFGKYILLRKGKRTYAVLNAVG